MRRSVLVLFVILAYIHIDFCLGYNAKEIEEILNKVSDEDRPDFMRFYLMQGYQLKKMDDGIIVPRVHKNLTPQQSKDLFDYSLEHFKSHSVNTIICFPEGCVDIGDSGIHPLKKKDKMN